MTGTRSPHLGSVLIGAINPAFVEVKAIADVRPYNVHRAFHGDIGQSGQGIRGFRPAFLVR